MARGRTNLAKSVYILLPIGLITLAVMVGLHLAERTTPALSSALDAHPEEPLVPTVGSEWRRATLATAATEQQVQNPSGRPLLDAGMVYHALSQVELTEDGEVVINDKARSALESAFSRLPLDLSVAELEQLELLITQGLPGEAGVRVAHIVSSYYHYRVAEKDFNAHYLPGDDVAGAQTHFEQQVALRQAHLGYELAEQLYGEEQAHARYTLESMRIQSDETLSEAEKAAQQTALRAALPEGLSSEAMLALSEQSVESYAYIEQLRRQGADEQHVHYLEQQQRGLDAAASVANGAQEKHEWERRRSQFQQQQRLILEAGLSEADKQHQIDRLLIEYFTPREREAMQAE